MSARIAVGMGLVLVAVGAQGADWALDPKAAVLGTYNDNIRLTDVAGEEIKVSGAKIDAEAALRASTPRTTFVLTPQVRSTFYPGDEDQETTDWFVRMRSEYRAERVAGSLRFDYSLIDTLGDYFPQATVKDGDVLGEPDRGVGVGRTTISNQEERFLIAPAAVFEISPTRSFGFRAQYLDVSYDFQVPGDREDFDNLYGAVDFRQALSPTASISISTAFTSYSSAAGQDTDAYGVAAEWRNRLSDTAEIYARGGLSRVEVEDSSGGTSWDNGFVGGTGVRWGFEVTDIWIDASRTLDPNAAGDLFTRDQLLARLTHRLGPMTRLSVGARMVVDSPSGESGFADQTYANANLGLEWRFTRQWSLIGSYEYYMRDDDGSPTDAEANAFNLGVVFEPNRR